MHAVCRHTEQAPAYEPCLKCEQRMRHKENVGYLVGLGPPSGCYSGTCCYSMCFLYLKCGQLDAQCCARMVLNVLSRH